MSRYLAFAAIGLTLMLAAINATAIAVAFPDITRAFDASLVQAGWVLSIYQLVATIVMPLAGKASDIWGKKFIFMLSLVLFIAGSVLCAIAPNIHLLIFFRLIQGMGFGAFIPVAAGIVAELFPEKRQQFIGLFTSIFPIGQIIGPNLGAWLVTAFGWRWIFWVNVPLGIVAFIAVAVLIKRGSKEKGSLDLTGAGLLAGSLFALLSGISQLDNASGSGWGFPALLIGAGVVFTFILIRHTSRAKNSIIDWQVLRGKPFLAANIFNFIQGACLFGMGAFVPLYAVSLYNMSTLESGLILTPRSVGMMLASTITSFSLLKWGYRKPMIVGTLLLIISLFLLGMEFQGASLFGLQLNNTALLIAIIGISGLGMGIALPASNNACIELMPNRVASITGVRGMFRNSGGALSIAITTLLLDNIGSMALGFTVAFFGLGIVMLIALPLIFVMPKSPGETPPEVLKPVRQPEL